MTVRERLYRNKVTNIQPFQTRKHTHSHTQSIFWDVRTIRFVNIRTYILNIHVMCEYTSHSAYYNNVYSSKYYINVIQNYIWNMFKIEGKQEDETQRGVWKKAATTDNQIDSIDQANEDCKLWISLRISDKLQIDVFLSPYLPAHSELSLWHPHIRTHTWRHTYKNYDFLERSVYMYYWKQKLLR